MMAVIAKMILEKDPDFESLIAGKIRNYASSLKPLICEEGRTNQAGSRRGLVHLTHGEREMVGTSAILL